MIFGKPLGVLLKYEYESHGLKSMVIGPMSIAIMLPKQYHNHPFNDKHVNFEVIVPHLKSNILTTAPTFHQDAIG